MKYEATGAVAASGEFSVSAQILASASVWDWQ